MAGDELTPCEAELRRLIVEICEILHFQEPLREPLIKDWVRDMIERKIFTPDEEWFE